ncbi:50S ribosomal protein L4 [Candidatus Nomurabacteria bacterium]|nr:50S ribosomal protein L4 [Candidatus Nomurabacteria bacterium]USN94772.1 MAG: 50S ribosomal protein L4 [Candidatus Nomurabacteria bacterium]
MKTPIYNQEGKKVKDLELPVEIFGLSWNGDLVHETLLSMAANRRPTTAHTKDRGEVSGGGKKPWRQKGTGRARHGSSRSPIWVGGGTTHGPRKEKDYSRKINKKAKTKALFTLLSKKLKDGEVIFIDSLDIKDGKTKGADQVLKNIATVSGFEKLKAARKPIGYIVLGETNRGTHLAFRNIPKVSLDYVSSLDALELANRRYLIVANPEKFVESLQAKVNKK